jgi:diguanylate cyclase (GGDEF)-like protein/hemerythrin-like metal-binding protein
MAFPRFQLNSLKNRIILLVLGIFLLAFLALATYVKGLLRDELLVFVGEQQRSTLHLLTSEVNRALQERLKTLKTVSVSAGATPLDSAAVVRMLLAQRPFLADFFNGGVHVWNLEGVLLADAAEPAADLASSAVDPQDLAEVLTGGKDVIGRVQVLHEPQMAAFALLVPLYNIQGEVSGALGGIIRLDQPNFLTQIAAHRYGRTGNLFLLDARQRLIFATSETPRLLETLPPPGVNPWIDRFVQGFEGTARVVNPRGVEVLVSIEQIPLAHWYASVTLMPQEAFSLIDAIKVPARMVGLALLLLCLGFMGWLLRRQLAPMTVALTALDGFVRGNHPPQALPVVRPDEIGQLVAGFNRLLDTLAQQQRALQVSELFKQSVLNSVTAAIAVLDGQGRIVMANDAWQQLLPDTKVGANCLEINLAVSAHAASSLQPAPSDGIRAVLEGRAPRYYNECACHTDLEQSWRSISVTPLQGLAQQGAVVSIEDISQRVQMEEQVRALAFYDPLTGLPNRRLALERLTLQLVQARRAQSRLALMFIDLDHFKPINDELGHEVGDWLLHAVAQRIQGCLRESDTAARLGGDEFVVLLPDLQTVDAALAVAEKIRAALAQEFVTDRCVVLGISSSIGVAIYPDHAQNDKDLLRLGDEAMYRAKKHGRNAVELCQSMHADLITAKQADRQESAVHLRWKAAFSCGNPEIDQQHQDLFRQANALLDALTNRHGQIDSFDATFLQFLSHVMAHFQFEERFLTSIAYVDVASHAQLHQELVAKAQELYAAAQADDDDSTAHDQLIKFLVNDLVAGHILTADRAFFSVLPQVGAATP